MDRLIAKGISRLADAGRTLGVAFNRRPTDDEMRKIHDLLHDPDTLSQEAVRDEVVEALEEGYAVLADITNQWEGRHTIAGQKLLCKMRDAIASATGISGEFVQDNATNPLKREPNAAATALEGWQKAIREELTPAPAAPVAEMVRRLRKHCEMIGHSSSGHETALHTRNADAAEAALLEKLGQGWIPEPVAWRREWDGDVSDIGNMLYASSRDELDEPLSRWQPLYAREPGASDE